MRDLIKSQPVYEIQYYGKTFRMNAAQVLHDKYMIWCGEQLWSAFVLASVVALVICLITFFVVSWILGRQGKQQSENEVTGGRQLTDNPKEVARMLKKDGKDSDNHDRPVTGLAGQPESLSAGYVPPGNGDGAVEPGDTQS